MNVGGTGIWHDVRRRNNGLLRKRDRNRVMSRMNEQSLAGKTSVPNYTIVDFIIWMRRCLLA